MNKKIIAIALAAMMLAVILPANAAIQVNSLQIRGEAYDSKTSHVPAGVVSYNTIDKNFTDTLINNDCRVFANQSSGKWEYTGTAVAGSGATCTAGPVGMAWSAYNFPAYWYNLDNGDTSEVMYYDDGAGTTNPSADITTLTAPPGTIDKNELKYETRPKFVQYKLDEGTTGDPDRLAYVIDHAIVQNNAGGAGFDNVSDQQGYAKIGWLGAEYVALGGDATKLSKLIKEFGTATSEKKTLTTGDIWDVGGGWTLQVQSLDAKASPRKAWMTLSYNGNKIDDVVVEDAGAKRVYTYVEKSIAGKSDVPLFITYVDSVFSGTTTDMVQLRYTWAISRDVTTVSSDSQIGSFKVRTASSSVLKLDNENSIDLNKDSTADIAVDLKFVVANDDNNLRFYPKVDYEILGEGVTPTPGAGTPSATVAATTPKVNVTGMVNVTETITAPPTEAGPAEAATPTEKEPGFEAIFAIAGLLAVAFLVLRQRK